MKKSILLFAFASVILLGCNSNDSEENTDSDSIVVNENTEMSKISETDEEQLEDNALENKLSEILKKNKDLIFEQLNGLKKAIANQDEMKTLAEVEKALKMRDSLVYLLNNTEEFYTYMEKEDADRLYENFEAIGIQVVEAEGMFGMLDQAPIFEKVIEKVADEPYILFNKIKNLDASSHGSEYPYFDITEEMEIVPLAEKMLTKYPGHKYNKKILELLGYALYPLTDFHKTPEDFAHYVVGGYDISAYPGATDISFHQSFIEKYSNSRFAKVVEKIVENPSSISTREFNKLYIIEVPDLKTDSVFADDKLNEELKKLPKDLELANNCIKYMWLGLDIPHTLNLREGDDNRLILVYRFFDKKEFAEKSLTNIRKIIPRAKLIEHLFSADEK